MSSNIYNQSFDISINDKRQLNHHNSFLIFFTGFSGSGKSTIANALEKKLYFKNIRTILLDGDNIRGGINSDLEFSGKDRKENIRRIAYISELFIKAGVVVIASFIAPFAKDREFVKSIVKPSNFIEVFVNTSIEDCEKRDVKGLYKKAREGKIANFTGISSPYEVPENPDIEIKTKDVSIEESVESIYRSIKENLKLRNE